VGEWIGEGELGGRQGPAVKYRGRPLPQVHQKLGISESDFQVFLSLAGQAMDEAKVQPLHRSLLLAKLASKGDQVIAERINARAKEDPKFLSSADPQ
jgi:truncated hemoglobin YjbI